MSTRCNIIIAENDKPIVYLYHHCDGYPEYMGALLDDWAANYKGEANATAARASIMDIQEYSDEKIAKYGYRSKNGFEDTTCIHGDIEYLYVIAFNDGKMILTCREVSWDFKDDFHEEHGYIDPSFGDIMLSEKNEEKMNKEYACEDTLRECVENDNKVLFYMIKQIANRWDNRSYKSCKATINTKEGYIELISKDRYLSGGFLQEIATVCSIFDNSWSVQTRGDFTSILISL